jgi:phage-related protein
VGLTNLERANYQVERAHYLVKKAAEDVEAAQRKYNEAVAKYGPESEKAQAAAKELQMAQERYQLAVERVQMSQDHANATLAYFAASVVPTVISMVNSGITVFQNFQSAVQLVSGAMSFLAANPIILAIAGIGALIAILVVAYEKCEPFRNAINAIGSAIYNFFKPAVDAIIGALTLLWNNVVSPFIDTLKRLWDTITNNPILAALFGPITIIAYLIKHWDDVTKTLRDGLDWLWNKILKPLGDFLIGVFKKNVELVGGAVNWLWDHCFKPLGDGLQYIWDHVLKPLADWLSHTFKPVVDAIGNAVSTIKGAVDTVGGVMKGFTDAVGGAMKGAGDAIGKFISSICFAHAIHNAVESSVKDLDMWVGKVEESMSKGAESIKGFVSEIGKPALTVGAGAAGAPAYPYPAFAPMAASISAPITIQIQGTSEEIANYVRTKLVKELKDTLIEATSSAAPVSKKIVLPKTFVR